MDDARLAEIEATLDGDGFCLRTGFTWTRPNTYLRPSDVRDLIAEVTRLQGITRGEYICRKCGIRQEGQKEKAEF